MKSACSALLVLAATPALAHPGHVGLADGHAHLVAIAAAAAAMLIVAGIVGERLWQRQRGAWRRRRA